MNELMARSLSPKELAEEFRYHDDPGVARLAVAFIEDGRNVAELEQEIERADDAANSAKEAVEAAEQEVADLKDLLRDCREHLYQAPPDEAGDLINRITAVL